MLELRKGDKMKVDDEIRCRLLLEYIRLENEKAARETQHRDGWLSDHAYSIACYGAEIDTILAKGEVCRAQMI